MKKKELLKHWKSIKSNLRIKPRPVAYKHTGSTFDEDSIRLTGTPEFIDSVLSRVKDVLAYENGSTRLQVSYKQSVDRKTQKPLDSYQCYIQVHRRGNQAIMANAICGIK